MAMQITKLKENKGEFMERINRYSMYYNQIYDQFTQTTLSDEKVLELLNKYYNELENGKFYNRRILFVEDGSVDVEKLEDDGFYCVVYRQGATPPQYLKD